MVCVFGKCGGVVFDIIDVMVWVIGDSSVFGVNGILLLVNLFMVKVVNMSFGGVGNCFFVE